MKRETLHDRTDVFVWRTADAKPFLQRDLAFMLRQVRAAMRDRVRLGTRNFELKLASRG